MTATWCTRLDFDRPYQMVSIEDDGNVKLCFMPGNGQPGVALFISRKDARLFARRINQCLDAKGKA